MMEFLKSLGNDFIKLKTWQKWVVVILVLALIGSVLPDSDYQPTKKTNTIKQPVKTEVKKPVNKKKTAKEIALDNTFYNLDEEVDRTKARIDAFGYRCRELEANRLKQHFEDYKSLRLEYKKIGANNDFQISHELDHLMNVVEDFKVKCGIY